MADRDASAEGPDGLKIRIADERRRELAVEHLLFRTIRHVERAHPGLIDELERSLDRLGDSAHDDTKDDEAVRAVARKFLHSLRAES